MNLLPLHSSVLAKTFHLTDEERYALVDIVRYGSVENIPPVFRDQLLYQIANAAVLTLYGEGNLPKPDDLEFEEPPGFDPSEHQLALKFIPLFPLPKSTTIGQSTEANGNED